MEKLEKYFVYGTLQDFDILKAVLPDFEIEQFLSYGTVYDFQAVKIENELYPALIKKDKFNSTGKILEFTKNQIKRLNYFEGDDYCTRKIHVFDNKNNKIKSNVFFIDQKVSNLKLTNRQWSFFYFLQSKDLYLKHTKKYMQDFNE